MPASPLRDHVAHIVCMRSGKQMIGIAAGAIVAFMTNKHTVGNRAIMQHVRNPMSGNDASSTGQRPISRSEERALPFPALISFALGHVFPKGILKRQFAPLVPVNVTN